MLPGNVEILGSFFNEGDKGGVDDDRTVSDGNRRPFAQSRRTLMGWDPWSVSAHSPFNGKGNIRFGWICLDL